jgi:hypothetical protein
MLQKSLRKFLRSAVRRGLYDSGLGDAATAVFLIGVLPAGDAATPRTPLARSAQSTLAATDPAYASGGGKENVCCDKKAMTGEIGAEASSKDGGLSVARSAGGGALRPRDEKGLACLWEYVKQHDTALVPSSHKTADGFWLGWWVCRCRTDRGANPVLDRLLESLPGWAWDAYERKFEEQVALYQRVAEAGKLNRHRALVRWAWRQRRLARECRVSADRLERLRSAGVL